MRRMFCTVVGVLLAAIVVAGRQLQPHTLSAYDRYVAATEARLAGELTSPTGWLWVDTLAGTDRTEVMTRLHRGDVVVRALDTRESGRPIPIDDGLIHHWVGTVLLPGVPVDTAIRFVQDYDRYPQVFAPMIPRARILTRTGDRYVVSMRTSVKKVITVVMDADYAIEYTRLGPTRVQTTNVATNLHEVHDAGTPRERREPGDQASGYLWRFRMYCRFDERPEGSLEQCESITLTRDIPFGVAWLVKPFVTSIPRETMAFTLGKVREALVP